MPRINTSDIVRTLILWLNHYSVSVMMIKMLMGAQDFTCSIDDFMQSRNTVRLIRIEDDRITGLIVSDLKTGMPYIFDQHICSFL